MTSIEWTHAPGFKGETWNPIVGCSIASAGCRNCYAMRTAGTRLENNPATPHYSGLTEPSNVGPVWTGKIATAPDSVFLKPLRWKAPRMVFVNSMGDLFHENTPTELIDRVFAIMALCPNHRFLVLTKRAARMREYMQAARAHPVGLAALDLTLQSYSKNPKSDVGKGCILQGDICHLRDWPLPNVWLGVSAEDQRHADERIPELLATPAAKRFVSAEPLLGPIDFTTIRDQIGAESFVIFNALYHKDSLNKGQPSPAIDWIIAGGESGPGARPAHPDWFRSIRDQCKTAGVPFFFKQWGEHLPVHLTPDEACMILDATVAEGDYRQIAKGAHVTAMKGQAFARVGKAAAGAMLDGCEHKEWPQ